jgi:hypothetical protein
MNRGVLYIPPKYSAPRSDAFLPAHSTVVLVQYSRFATSLNKTEYLYGIFAHRA